MICNLVRTWHCICTVSGGRTLASDVSWERIASDYDITNGGLMLFGLTLMVFAPLLAAKIRGL